MITLIAIHIGFITSFYPPAGGTLGADYPHHFARMASTELFLRNNGFTHIPWFTPAFCAGSFHFVNPIDASISLPQLISIFSNPLTAVWLSHIFFVFIGGISAYRLSRSRPFSLQPWPALLVASTFAANGFYAAHLVNGHLNFHPFMLAPAIAWLLIRPHWQSWFAAGALAAMVILSGGVHLVVPIAISTLIIYFMANLIEPIRWQEMTGRLLLAITTSIVLCLSKVTVAVALSQNTPRDLYMIPGLDSFTEAILLPFISLVGYWDMMPNSLQGDWHLASHEFDASIGPFVFLPICYGCYHALRNTPAKCLVGLLFGALIYILVAMANFYHPIVQQVLEAIPLVNQSSTLFRWYAAFLIAVPLLAGLSLGLLPSPRKDILCIGLILCTTGWQMLRTLPWTKFPTVDLNPLLVDLDRSRQEGVRPITTLAVKLTKAGKPAPVSPDRDIYFMQGKVELFCADPIFGYRNELLRIDNLQIGDVTQQVGQELNLKNPACYVFPKENRCQPGDNFRPDQIDQMLRFIHFLDWSFVMPNYQKGANYISLIGWLLTLALGALGIVRHFRRNR